jgi:hypothetical protein
VLARGEGGSVVPPGAPAATWANVGETWRPVGLVSGASFAKFHLSPPVSHTGAYTRGRASREGMGVKGRNIKREMLFFSIFTLFSPFPCFTLRG